MKFFQPVSTPILPQYANFVNRQLNVSNITRECPVSQKIGLKLFDTFDDPAVYDKPLNALFPIKVPLGVSAEWVRETASDFKANVDWYEEALYQEVLGDNFALFQYVFDDKNTREIIPKESIYAIFENARYQYYQLYLQEKMSLQTYHALKETIGTLIKGDFKQIKKKIFSHPVMREKIIVHREKQLQKQFFDTLTIQTDLSSAKHVISETRYILRKMFENNPEDKKLFLAFANKKKKLVITLGENEKTEKRINYFPEKDEIFIAMLPPPMENSRLVFHVAKRIFKNHLRQAMMMRFYSLSDHFKIKLFDEKSLYLDSKDIMLTFIDKKKLSSSEVYLIRSDASMPPTISLEVFISPVNTGLALASREVDGGYFFFLGGRTYESKGGKNNGLIVALPKNSKTTEVHQVYTRTVQTSDSFSDKLINTHADIFQESLKIWFKKYKDAPDFGRELTRLLSGWGAEVSEFFGSGVMEQYRNNLDNLYYRFGLNVEPDPSLFAKKEEKESYTWTVFQTLMDGMRDFFNTVTEPASEEEISSDVQEKIRKSMK